MHAAPVAQLALSTVCWLVLAWVVSTFLDHRVLRVAAFVAVLGFSLSRSIGQWDGALLSESLTFSELALLVAALLVVVRSPGRRNVLLVVLATVAFAGTRDANAYLAVMLVLPVAGLLWLRRRQAPAVALALSTVAVAALVYGSYTVERWQIEMRDVVAIRVVPSPSMSRYFTARGMPLPADLPRLLYTTREPPSPFAGNPALDSFHAWLERSGRSTYERYLLLHPGYALLDPLRDLGTMIGPTWAPGAYVVAPGDSLVAGMRFYEQDGYRPALPGPLQSLFYPLGGWVALCWFVCALLLLGALTLLEVARAFWIVPALLIAVIFPYAVITWDATPLEIARHSLLVGALGRLGLWLTALFTADVAGAAVARVRAGLASSAPG